MGLLDTLLGSRNAGGGYSGGLLSIPGQLAGGLLGSVITPVQRGLWGTSSQDIAAQRKQLLDQAQQDRELQRQLLQMQLDAAQTAQAQRGQDQQTALKFGDLLNQQGVRQWNAQNPGDLQMVENTAQRSGPQYASLDQLMATPSFARLAEQNPRVKALTTPQKLGPGDIIGSPMGGTLMSNPKSQQEGAGFGNVNPGDFTPASLAKYAQTRNFADLVLKPTAGQQPPSGYSWGQGGTLTPIRGGPADPSAPANIRKQMEGATGLRKEFDGSDAVKNYRQSLTQFQRASTAPNTRAGDLSIVYALGKIFDPASVVREGELKLSKDAQPWLSKMVSEAQSQIIGTGAIDARTRAAMIDAIRGQVDAMAQSYAQERERFSGYATNYGYRPEDVVGADPAAAFKPQRAVTRTGRTKDGRKVVQYSDGSIEYGN